MRPLLSSSLLLFLLLAVPLYADDKDSKPKQAVPTKPANEKPAPDKPEPDKYVPVGRLGGVVRNAGDAGSGITLRVTFRYLERNVEAQRRYVQQVRQLLIRQQQIILNPNLPQAMQQMNQLHRDAQRLMQSQKDLFRIKSVDKDVEVGLAEDVKVRSAQPVQQFDDKGNIKRYTAQELKELRGPDKLPGFSAELSDVRPGQTVIVKVVRLRAAKAADVPPVDKSAPTDSTTKAAPIRLGPQFTGTMVIIVGDPVK